MLRIELCPRSWGLVFLAILKQMLLSDYLSLPPWSRISLNKYTYLTNWKFFQIISTFPTEKEKQFYVFSHLDTLLLLLMLSQLIYQVSHKTNTQLRIGFLLSGLCDFRQSPSHFEPIQITLYTKYSRTFLCEHLSQVI